MKVRRLTSLALLLTCAFASPAAAEFPDRPIHLIVPQAAGSSTDTLDPRLAAALSTELGQTVVVDDRPGGALTSASTSRRSRRRTATRCAMGPIGALAITRHMVANRCPTISSATSTDRAGDARPSAARGVADDAVPLASRN